MRRFIYEDATVAEVTDGDTFVAHLDFGFKCFHEPEIRLRGVNAPEKHNPNGPGATAFLADLLGDRTLRIETFKNPRAKNYQRSFTRFIADVWLPGDDRTVAERIISAGFGVPFDPKKDHWTR